MQLPKSLNWLVLSIYFANLVVEKFKVYTFYNIKGLPNIYVSFIAFL